MSTYRKRIAVTTFKLAAAAALLASLAACSGMSRQQAHAAIGAGAGGALGYVLTGGPVGTIAGAAAGGLIGAGVR
jgi:osmotically inducible lipoprotein OsmB